MRVRVRVRGDGSRKFDLETLVDVKAILLWPIDFSNGFNNKDFISIIKHSYILQIIYKVHMFVGSLCLHGPL